MAGLKGEKVVVAMSGGVDSSVAACLLHEAGYDVTGLFMRVGAEAPGTEEDPLGSGRRIEVGGGAEMGTVAQAEACGSEGTPVGNRCHTPEACGSGGTPVGNRCHTSEARGSGGTPVGNRCHTAEARGSGSSEISLPVRSHQGCCSAADAGDARFVAGMLGIGFYALNFKGEFDRIIDYFADEYLHGRTPNPCVMCNTDLKFGKIVEYADAIGARYVATGHYARIGERGGRRVLMRGRDRDKDQSYVLFGIGREVLDRAMFPVGEYTKAEVRALAARFNLPNRDKPDSVEICFVPDRDYARVVRARRPDAFVPGDVVDGSGRVLGRHGGIGGFTVGQRRGLGIAAGVPIYVTNIDRETNTITVGPRAAVMNETLVADGVHFLADPPGEVFRAAVQIRYLHAAAPATVRVVRAETPGPLGCVRAGTPGPLRAGTPGPLGAGTDESLVDGGGDQIHVTFDEAQPAITPGQAVVLYDGEMVIGGGWIVGSGETPAGNQDHTAAGCGSGESPVGNRCHTGVCG